MRASGVSEGSAATAYRLRRTVLNIAVDDDGILFTNPGRIPGGGVEHPPERPTLTIAQVLAPAEGVPRPLRGDHHGDDLRQPALGEVAALRRRDVDLDRGVFTVRSAFVETGGAAPTHGPTKTKAGVRAVTLPQQVVDLLMQHIERYVQPGEDSYLFTGKRGLPIWRGNFGPLVDWKAEIASVGAPDLHFHDLRHTGNTLAARVPGTSTRDLMRRMGHDSMRAALIYQRLSSDSDSRVAAGLTTQLGNAAAETTEVIPDGTGIDESGGNSARGVHGGGEE